MESKPDWWILKGIADKIDKARMKYNSVVAIQNEIKKVIKGFPAVKKRIAFKHIELKGKVIKHGRGRYAAWKSSYRGVPHGDTVSGISIIESNSICASKEGQAYSPVAEGGMR